MRRRSVALLYALVALSALPGDAQESRSTVSHAILFVCEHGSAKSVIAAAHSNVSRGLAGDGLVVTGWKPRAVMKRTSGKRIV